MEKQSALEVICEAVKLISDYDGTVSRSTRFWGDGISSLELIEIVMECEKKLYVTIPDNVVYNHDLTIGSLADWIEAEQVNKM